METNYKTKIRFGRPLNLRVDPELYRQFEQIARANDRTVSGEIRRVMREHIASQLDSEQAA